MITGNDFIDILYLSEMDEKVLNMRKELDAPKPIIDKDFKKYGGNSMPIENLGIELFFEDPCDYDNNEIYKKGDIYFAGISFAYNTKIEPPFNIKMGDNLEEVVNKIGKEQTYNTKRFPQKVWKFERDDGKLYLLYAFFDKEYSEVLNIKVLTYGKAVEKLPKHI
ncbi:hypothetical protein KO488_00825 [Poseidonibacter lekithochrous]|uniref:hypothetical protein n=1 Tax=Poseidonibacter TaxID=2321187 RepID=UPI001C0A62B7|nr:MULTISPECIES: hypothetical protein [Poseidonibacter]MBU3013279.1 hypothetical protein [Poseidonibacter lekithochrous]MDO6826576.1 hypothetical protein [Poseidonibacter sp. 1_MG-2023]